MDLAGELGPKILAIHGFLGRGQDFGWLAEGLDGKYLVAVDLPGHGDTPKLLDTLDFPCLSSFVTAQCRTHEAQFLMGYSMGARLSLAAALDGAGLEGLVLISGTAGIRERADREKRVRLDTGRATALRAQGMEPFLESWFSQPVTASQLESNPEIRDHLLGDRKTRDPELMAQYLEGCGTGVMPYLGEKLADLAMPVLLVTGENDRKFNEAALDLYRALSNVTLEVIPGVGHAPHLEAPDRTAAAISQFIDTVAGTAG